LSAHFGQSSPRGEQYGHLRLSLVSCPVYLSPTTTETKRIRLNQINAETGNRVRQQLVDEDTGEVVERHQVAKGYEHDRGRYVLIDDDELRELQVESSKVIDLTRFVDREEVDPVYLDAPYYIYPDGKLAVEAFRVIGQAMAAKGLSGIGKVTLSSRERLVLIEPRGGGLLMSTLRSADEVRAAEFNAAEDDASGIDPDMLSIAETIIERRKGAFDPVDFRDSYQDALRGLVENKLKGIATTPRAIAAPPKVIDLMEALKRSLMEGGVPPAQTKATKRAKVADRNQPQLLMPVQGGRKAQKPVAEAEPAPTVAAPSRRKKAS
jgi:DNA end-binding protein Ku